MCDCSDRKYFKCQIFLLQIIGMYPVDYTSSLPKSMSFLSYSLNFLFTTVAQFMPLHLTILHIITVIMKLYNGDNVIGFAVLIIDTIVYSFAYLIMMYYYRHANELTKIFNCLNKELVARSLHGATYFRINSGYRKSVVLTIFWILMCFSGTLQYGVASFFRTGRKLPLECKYPFDVYESPVYEIIYFSQILAQSQLGAIYAISTGVFMGLMILICGQYDILFCSLKNIYFSVMLRLGNEECVRYFEISVKIYYKFYLNDI